MSEVILIGEWEVSILSINPAGSRLHEIILAGKFLEYILLQHHFSICLVFLTVSHMLRKQTKSMQYSLTMAEIFLRRSLEIIYQQCHVVSQILRNLVLSSLSDVADCLYQLLVGSLDVVDVGHIDLKAHILNCIF